MQRHLCCLGKRWPALQFIQFRYKTHYEVLGISQNASKKEIRAAFLEKSKKLHPDQNKSDPKTHDKFVELNSSYSVLSKEDSRRDYDRSLQPGVQYRDNDLGYRPTSQTPPQGTQPPGYDQKSKEWSYDGHDTRAAYEKYEQEMRARAHRYDAHQSFSPRALQLIRRITAYVVIVWFSISFLFASLRARSAEMRRQRQMIYNSTQPDSGTEPTATVSEGTRRRRSREDNRDEERIQQYRARRAAVRTELQQRVKEKDTSRGEEIIDSGRSFRADDAKEMPTV